MKPTGAAARMNMARAGSMGSVNSNNSYEDTPRADLQTTPVRQNPQRTTNGGVGVCSLLSLVLFPLTAQIQQTHTDDMLLKKDLTFHANCLLRRQFA